jgi:hypothetical protein
MKSFDRRDSEYLIPGSRAKRLVVVTQQLP